MPTPIPTTDDAVVFRFGGGLNRTHNEQEISRRATVDGKNFQLELDNFELRPRGGFTKLGTAPNGGSIDGFAQLIKIGGERTTLIQAGTNVYLFDGTNFTLVGTVNAGTRMRGSPIDHQWTLDDKVLITDLELKTPLLEWDGTTFRQTVTNLSQPFFAKYCVVDDDRAVFANVQSGIPTPHVVLVSALEDYRTLTVTDRPASEISAADPIFLTMPDLKAINGTVNAFDVLTFSTVRGRIYRLNGSDSTDFSIDKLYPNSGSDAAESLTYIGNDIVYARQGKIESLRGTLDFGDVINDDISRKIAPDITNETDWVVAYDSRLQRVLFWNDQRIFVFHSPVANDREESPWSLWDTQHSSNFEKTSVFTIFDPRDGIERVFWGDKNGNVYVFDDAADDDGTDIITEWTTPLISAPVNAQASSPEGWIKYHQIDEDVIVDLQHQFGGIEVHDEPVTVNLLKREVDTNGAFWNGESFWNGDDHWGQRHKDRSRRAIFNGAGRGEDFQLKIKIESGERWAIQEIGLRYNIASS